jgi:hypothetical protein
MRRALSPARLRTISAFFLASALAAGAASLSDSLSQSDAPSQAMNFTVEGKITEHTPGKLTLRAEGNMVFHVRYDDKTEVKSKDGSPASAKDLRTGLKVRIEGELTEAGEVIAQRIQLEEEPPPPKH